MIVLGRDNVNSGTGHDEIHNSKLWHDIEMKKNNTRSIIQF